MSAILQRCSVCKADLPLTAFPKSHLSRKGACSKCHCKRQRIGQLKRKYGLTPADVQAMEIKQHHRCLGCNQELPPNFVIDHDHKTGVVRGLLCRPCNLVLGLVNEHKGRLTQLRLYLDRIPDKPMVYTIGSLRNPEVPKIANRLRKEGFEICDEWVAAGPTADDCWQQYETDKGHDFKQALHSLSAQNVFWFDRALLHLADAAVLIMPAGKSAHMEIGYMAAQGKPTFVLLDKEPDRYDVMAQFVSGVVTEVDSLIKELKHAIRHCR